MANVLVIDDQDWVVNLCTEALSGEEHLIITTNDIECIGENAASFKPDIIILNLYLKHGFLVWDVLSKLKEQNPDVPVLIVTEYEDFLSDPRLSKADGHVIKNPLAADELRQKISFLLCNNSFAHEDSELRLVQPAQNEAKKSCDISRYITTDINSK